ncbi:MAG: carbohydrate kinase family protein [Clostridia bacterium]
MFDVVALGELLIDFTPAGESTAGSPLFEQNPGGAPANVLVALAQFGKRTAFIGKVGQDPFGMYLRSVLLGKQIHVDGLVLSHDAPTTLAFVHLDASGERSFSFYRNPGADQLLEAGEIEPTLLQAARMFHFGSNSLTDEPIRSATLFAVKAAKQKGAVISFDPNIRLPLWTDAALIEPMIREVLPYADVLKLSLEEMQLLTGCTDPKTGTLQLYETYGTRLIFVTVGPEGCFFRAGERIGGHSGFTVKTVDTTGAGDAFWGAVLSQLLEREWMEPFAQGELERIATFANAAGALCTTRKGAIPAIPEPTEITRLIEAQSGMNGPK